MQLPNALYSPYGAYELKARYQHNFGLGTLMTLSFILLILLSVWVVNKLGEDDIEAIDLSARVIKTVADLGPPPSVAKKPPQVNVNQPQIAAPKVGIPKPVADDEVADEDVVLATRDELAEIVAPDITASGQGDGEIIVDISDDDYMPAPDEFVPVEEVPQFIHQEQPEYPRLARQAGITGLVWVKALVGKDGNVLKAQVGRSSGTPSLDQAAVDAAFKNKFRPGIQNGRPVNCWVTYKVNFELNQ